jgi:hypothetical protein
MFGELEVSEAQTTITGRTAYHSQLRGAFGYLFGWTALDAMIGDLLVCYVGRLLPGHVAAIAVQLIRVVLADESRLSVAGKTPASKVRDPLSG